MNIASYIKKTVREFPKNIAIRMGEDVLRYEQFDFRARSLASYLRSNGFVKGDKLGIYLPNCPDYLIVMYAVWMIGGVVVPINYRFRIKELKWDDSEIKWLVIPSEDVTKYQSILSSIPEIQLLPLGNKEGVSLETIYQMDGLEIEIVQCLDSEDAMIMYTSGTTGKPKGVRQTHRNKTSSIEMVIDAWQLTSRDHLLGTFPMFHVGGLQCTTLPALFTWDYDAFDKMEGRRLVNPDSYIKTDMVWYDLYDVSRRCQFYEGKPCR